MTFIQSKLNLGVSPPSPPPNADGLIFAGRKFPGPVELVKHHATQLDGFLTLARLPLDRPPGDTPIVLQGVHAADLEEKLRLKAMEMGLKVSGYLPIETECCECTTSGYPFKQIVDSITIIIIKYPNLTTE